MFQIQKIRVLPNQNQKKVQFLPLNAAPIIQVNIDQAKQIQNNKFEVVSKLAKLLKIDKGNIKKILHEFTKYGFKKNIYEKETEIFHISLDKDLKDIFGIDQITLAELKNILTPFSKEVKLCEEQKEISGINKANKIFAKRKADKTKKFQNYLKRTKKIKINQAKVQMKLQMKRKITNKIMIEMILK